MTFARKPACALLGFANLLLRFYREEQPRAVLVAGRRLRLRPTVMRKFPPSSRCQQIRRDILAGRLVRRGCAAPPPKRPGRSGRTQCSDAVPFPGPAAMFPLLVKMPCLPFGVVSSTRSRHRQRRASAADINSSGMRQAAKLNLVCDRLGD